MLALRQKTASDPTMVINGNVSGPSKKFSVFGEPSAQPVLSYTTSPVNYGYTGREFDVESNANYHRARLYNPNIGRFLSQDPIGMLSGDSNYYRAMANNPLRYTDPTGLTCDPMDIELQQAQTINNGLAEGTDAVTNLITGYATVPFLPVVAAGAVAGAQACAANPASCVVVVTNAASGFATGYSNDGYKLPPSFMAPYNGAAGSALGGVAYGVGFSVGKGLNYMQRRP